MTNFAENVNYEIVMSFYVCGEWNARWNFSCLKLIRSYLRPEYPTSLRCVLSFLFLNGPCSVVDRPVSFMFMLFLCKKDMVQVAVYRRWCLNVRQAIHVEHSVLSSPCAVLGAETFERGWKPVWQHSFTVCLLRHMLTWLNNWQSVIMERIGQDVSAILQLWILKWLYQKSPLRILHLLSAETLAPPLGATLQSGKLI